MHIKEDVSSLRIGGALWSWCRPTAIAVVVATMGMSAHADPASDRIRALEEKLEQSLKQISALTERVKQLESKGPATQNAAAQAPSGSPQTSAAAESADRRIEALEQEVSAITNRSTQDDGLPIHGFASVGSVFTNKTGAKNGATIESVDFYLTPQLGDRVRGLFEMNTEASQDGTVGVDLERLQLGYVFGDELTLWAGRFHTPYGYWNTAFHHGAQIQTSILRPRFLDFEDSGGILPAHNVGLWGHGQSSLSDTKLTYDIWLANSPHLSANGNDPSNTSNTQDPSLKGATNGKALMGFKVGVTPSFLGGATVGLHAYASRVGGPDTGYYASQTISSSKMAGGYATYLENDWEVLSEYYRFHDRNENPASPKYQSGYYSWAGYIQVGYNYSLWTPYARFEKTRLNQNDDYFAAQASGRSYTRTVAGVRYELGSRSALKLEFNRTRQGDPDVSGDTLPGNFNETRLQFAVRF
ncbi:MAG: hypothetical protein EKK47_06415 [Burkholderiales bacterium]|jgi:hypothetical protein|nr:MAG: hypothetical protein EKK47_06415 [Burkholderiales bacterium]